MTKLSRSLFGFCLALTATCIASAQDTPQPMSMPKVLQIIREFTKPGKGGAVHDKAEAAFVQAMARAKWPTHYLAATSMSGKPRVLFFIPYDSFEAWEKDNLATAKNTSLSNAMDHASMADGELLDSSDVGVFAYNEDLSLRPQADLAQMRYVEIFLFKVRPGQRKTWEELVKLYKSGYEKATPDVNWATYEESFGPNGSDTYVAFSPHKSLSEIDRGFADDKAFATALGPDGMKRLAELSALAVESSQTNLFSFSPRMSYPPDRWVKVDPDFWKPKAAGAPTAKPGAKPKTGAASTAPAPDDTPVRP
ncbi:MAG: hypothetical protein NVS9B4_23470 [Candidatus Acidiferrum sp.]